MESNQQKESDNFALIIYLCKCYTHHNLQTYLILKLLILEFIIKFTHLCSILKLVSGFCFLHCIYVFSVIFCNVTVESLIIYIELWATRYYF